MGHGRFNASPFAQVAWINVDDERPTVRRPWLVLCIAGVRILTEGKNEATVTAPRCNLTKTVSR